MNENLAEEYLEELAEDYEDVRNYYLDSLKVSCILIVHYDLNHLKLKLYSTSEG